MSKRNSRKRKYVRGGKKRWKGEIKTYLVIVFMCLLIAAVVSFIKAKAPDMVKKVVVRKLAEQAKELGVEGIEDMDVDQLKEKYKKYMSK